MLLREERDDRVDILIAEDDADTRQSLRDLLEQQGYRCAEAGTGVEAVEVARQHSPQCVILDLVMPELDGFSVARRLRADPRTRGASIHCLTGLTDDRARAEATRAGCDEFLTKPVNVSALLRVLHDGLKSEAKCVSGLGMAEAEDLLDWLEAHGTAGEVDYEEGQGFTVRYSGLPGLDVP
jgi:CheY-like chemotaxis protein